MSAAPPPDIRSILVGDDSSPSADLAIRHAVLTARSHNAQLTILRVVSHTPGAFVLGNPGESLQEQLNLEAEIELRKRSARLPKDISSTTVMRHGMPAEEILSELEGGSYSIVMLGARGVTRRGGQLGSVASEVLSRSPVPVALFGAPI